MMINGRNTEVHAQANPAARAINLWLFENLKSGGVRIYQDVKAVVSDTSESAMLPAPTLIIDEFLATKLIDALWGAGVRPSTGEGHTAHIQALNAHLEDMRSLVFNK